LSNSFKTTLSSTSIYDNMTVDFGYDLVVNKGSIGDFVYEDTNKNGQYDTTDTPIKNAKVILIKSDGVKVETITSDKGIYIFTDLVKGEYRINVIASSVDLNLNLSIDPDDTIDGSHTVVLNENQVIDTVDFGFLRKTLPVVPTPPDNTPTDNTPTDNTPADKPSDEVKKGTLVVHHLDRFTNKPMIDEVKTEDEVGKTYKTSDKTFEGYEFVEVTDNKDGEYIDGEIVVIYYYEKNYIFEENETPQGSIIVPNNETPQGPTSLPKTGESSDILWFVFGTLFILIGMMRMFKKKERV